VWPSRLPLAGLSIRCVTLLAAPAGLALFEEAHPDVPFYAAPFG
jgi:uracil phosphoribosyltransferase